MGPGIVDALGKLLLDLPVNDVLRERLLLLKEQVEAMEHRILALDKENAELAEKVRELSQKYEAQLVPEAFTEHEGALFKRKPDGTWIHAVYCPSCKRSTGALAKNVAFQCSPCHWRSSFISRDLDEVMSRLP